MTNRIGVRLNLAREVVLVGAFVAALTAPFVVGLMNTRVISAQSAPTPKFEVISIKPCKGEPAPIPGRKSNRGGRLTPSPGRLTAECATLATLVRAAYIQYPEGQPAHFISPRVMQQEVKGSPSWYNPDRFTIEATTQGPQSREILMGPMLQGLLEDRFHLQIHRETREVPIYELRVAKSGPKFQPAKPGSCAVVDRDHPPPLDIGPETKPICGGYWGDHMYGTTMENLSRQLTATLDRDVVDKTGLTGQFDLHFQFPPADLGPAFPDGGPSAPQDPASQGTRLATNMEYAIPRLGLILQPAKGSGEFLVIDRVEKPAEN